jgi:hypothetical protein
MANRVYALNVKNGEKTEVFNSQIQLAKHLHTSAKKLNKILSEDGLLFGTFKIVVIPWTEEEIKAKYERDRKKQKEYLKKYFKEKPEKKNSNRIKKEVVESTSIKRPISYHGYGKCSTCGLTINSRDDQCHSCYYKELTGREFVAGEQMGKINPWDNLE